MNSRRELEMRLSALRGFDDPRVELEQYPTPADLAAHLIHLADLQDDLAGRTVLDLGAGTGILALGAALRGPGRTIGIERDPAALAVARENEASLDLPPPVAVDWILGDATRPPVCPVGSVTAIANPPFGAQRGNVHADRAFLEAIARLADVSYSIHNADSREFVEAFAGDEGGEVTHAYAAELELDRQFDHHARDRAGIDVEVFRIEWG